MAVLVSHGHGRTSWRGTLLPMAILVPMLTGWLNNLAETSGRYEEALVDAVGIVINVMILAGVTDLEHPCSSAS